MPAAIHKHAPQLPYFYRCLPPVPLLGDDATAPVLYILFLFIILFIRQAA